MTRNLEPGARLAAEIVVTDQMTVPGNADRLPTFADMPNVLATAYFVAFIEATCLDLLRPYLKEGEHSVGTLVNFKHTAATPVGMTMFCEAEVTEVDGQRVRFKVQCRDEVDEIGGGEHERFIIDVDRFMTRVNNKTAS
jgi:fluoroacetyl-CoA thioesterase